MGLVIHVDGGSRGNPGPAGAGVVISDESGAKLHEGAYFLGNQTNNSAEYQALIRGLQRAETLTARPIHIRSDSELLVRQLIGEYRVKNEALAALFAQVQMLLLRFGGWQIRHVPREQNRRADELANLAMDQRRDVIVFDAEAGGDGTRANGAEGASNQPASGDSPAAVRESAPADGGASGDEIVDVRIAPASPPDNARPPASASTRPTRCCRRSSPCRTRNRTSSPAFPR